MRMNDTQDQITKIPSMDGKRENSPTYLGMLLELFENIADRTGGGDGQRNTQGDTNTDIKVIVCAIATQHNTDYLYHHHHHIISIAAAIAISNITIIIIAIPIITITIAITTYRAESKHSSISRCVSTNPPTRLENFDLAEDGYGDGDGVSGGDGCVYNDGDGYCDSGGDGGGHDDGDGCDTGCGEGDDCGDSGSDGCDDSEGDGFSCDDVMVIVVAVVTLVSALGPLHARM